MNKMFLTYNYFDARTDEAAHYVYVFEVSSFKHLQEFYEILNISLVVVIVEHDKKKLRNTNTHSTNDIYAIKSSVNIRNNFYSTT